MADTDAGAVVTEVPVEWCADPDEVRRELARRPIVLVGMMGSGKSSVGRRLAKRLERAFFDSDHEIEARAGRTIPEIFEHDGEPAFRALEASMVAELLDVQPPAVIATGGGAVADPTTRAALRERTTTIWLRATAPALASRIKLDGSRPLLADDPRETIFRLVAEREPWYREVAQLIVDVDLQQRRVIAKRIRAALEGGAA